MPHGEKSNLFLSELEKLFKKYNICIGIEGSPEAKFCLLDLDGPMATDWRAKILDISINAVKSIASNVVDVVAPLIGLGDKPQVASTSDEEASKAIDESIAIIGNTPLSKIVEGVSSDTTEEEDLTDDAA